MAAFEKVYLLRFAVRGKDLPKEQFEEYVAIQARKSYARGYMLNYRPGRYRGRLEGLRSVLETFKQLMLSGEQFQPFIEKVIFRKLKMVTQCNYTIFEIREKPLKKTKTEKTTEKAVIQNQ